MSVVELTRPNTDLVNIELKQNGNAEAIARFKLPFMLPKTDYVVGVTSLTLPIQNTSLLGPAYPELFYIRRRNVGQLHTAAEHTELNGRGQIAALNAGFNLGDLRVLDALTTVGDIASAPVAGSTLDLMNHDTVGTFKTNTLPLQNLSDFLLLLNNFATVFTERIHQVGVDPRFYGGPSTDGAIPFLAQGHLAGAGDIQPMIDFGITPSGFLVITLQPLFSNHFYLDFSSMGKALLGIGASTIAITQNQNTGVITRFGEDLFDGAGLILPATVSVVVPISGSRSLLQTIESRISVHVTTDLPIMRTIVVENGQESSAYDLCSFSLKNQSSSRIYIDGFTVKNEAEFSTPTHSGQLVLQSRNEQPTQWSPVLSIDDLQQFRCRLMIKTREYDPVLEKWITKKTDFPFKDKSDFWTLGLRFVSME